MSSMLPAVKLNMICNALSAVSKAHDRVGEESSAGTRSRDGKSRAPPVSDQTSGTRYATDSGRIRVWVQTPREAMIGQELDALS